MKLSPLLSKCKNDLLGAISVESQLLLGLYKCSKSPWSHLAPFRWYWTYNVHILMSRVQMKDGRTQTSIVDLTTLNSFKALCRLSLSFPAVFLHQGSQFIPNYFLCTLDSGVDTQRLREVFEFFECFDFVDSLRSHSAFVYGISRILRRMKTSLLLGIIASPM